MLTTTAAFDTAIAAIARSIKARVTINFTDLFRDQTASGSTSDDNRVSQVEQVSDGKANSTYKWFSCDGSSILDGSYHPCPTDAEANSNEIGWWSQSISDGSGNFSSDAIVTATFASRSVTSYLVAGDIKREEYPVDFDIKFFAGAALQLTEVITGNTDVFYQDTITQINNITSMVVEISKWSHPNRVAKIVEASTAVTRSYDAMDISNLTVTEQREISNNNSIPTGNIAASDLSLSLMNADREFDANNSGSSIFGLVKPNNKVTVEIGVLTPAGFEYVPVFTGWTRGWDVPDNSITANVQALDILDFLTQTKITTSTVITNNTFSDWFEVVLNDAGLDNTFYDIDTVLDGTDYIVPFGWFSDISHREALQILATACSAAVYQDRDGIIQIQSAVWFDSHDLSSVQTFTRADYMDKSNQPIYENIANNIIVTTSPLVKTTPVTIYDTTAGEPETVAASTTETFTIFYTDEPVSDQVATIVPAVPGVSISSQTHFAWGSSIDVLNTNGSPTDFLFHVVGATYAVQGKQTITRSDSTSITNNGQSDFRFEDNAFLQKKVLAENIADALLASFKDPERDLTANFSPGGNPALEMSDRITLTDKYQSKEYNLISSTITYDGGMSQQINGRIT